MYNEKNTKKFIDLKSKLSGYNLDEDDYNDNEISSYEANIKSIIAAYFDDSKDNFPEEFILSHNPVADTTIEEKRNSVYLFGNGKVYQFYITEDDFIGGLDVFDLHNIKDTEYMFRFDKTKTFDDTQGIYAEKPELDYIRMVFENDKILVLRKNYHNKKRFNDIKEYIFKYLK